MGLFKKKDFPWAALSISLLFALAAETARATAPGNLQYAMDARAAREAARTGNFMLVVPQQLELAWQRHQYLSRDLISHARSCAGNPRGDESQSREWEEGSRQLQEKLRHTRQESNLLSAEMNRPVSQIQLSRVNVCTGGLEVEANELEQRARQLESHVAAFRTTKQEIEQLSGSLVRRYQPQAERHNTGLCRFFKGRLEHATSVDAGRMGSYRDGDNNGFFLGARANQTIVTGLEARIAALRAFAGEIRARLPQSGCGKANAP